ncbi:hypothetical protein E8E14_001429 [Neopestalotiopsis sp. 37M]|nr:hypothetical protein E8E14_001429 [Neopestalotiopsis sp. 37M]
MSYSAAESPAHSSRRLSVYVFISISNDVLSFYKEELGGDKIKNIHSRARSERKHVLQVLTEVEEEAIDRELRIQRILSGRAEYAKSWSDSVRGDMAMHTINPPYRLDESELGEEHLGLIQLSNNNAFIIRTLFNS